jgi:hypothetical protein
MRTGGKPATMPGMAATAEPTPAAASATVLWTFTLASPEKPVCPRKSIMNATAAILAHLGGAPAVCPGSVQANKPVRASPEHYSRSGRFSLLSLHECNAP